MLMRELLKQIHHEKLKPFKLFTIPDSPNLQFDLGTSVTMLKTNNRDLIRMSSVI